jgi:hypothetical protein
VPAYARVEVRQAGFDFYEKRHTGDRGGGSLWLASGVASYIVQTLRTMPLQTPQLLVAAAGGSWERLCAKCYGLWAMNYRMYHSKE